VRNIQLCVWNAGGGIKSATDVRGLRDSIQIQQPDCEVAFVSEFDFI